MRKKMLWGIVTLIILIIGTGVLMLIRSTDTDPIVIYRYTEPAKQTQTEIVEKPSARPGFKMVQHDDHWHEVPIDEPEIMQDEPTTQSDSVKPYTGKLTYHKELLETHPVEALRKQAEERGHWSAKWIPPFPADDHEASELASVVYTIVYNRHASLEESPEQDILAERSMRLIREYNTRYPPRSDDIQVRARNYDLTKLAWVILPYDDDDDDLRSELPSQFTVARRTQ